MKHRFYNNLKIYDRARLILSKKYGEQAVARSFKLVLKKAKLLLEFLCLQTHFFAKYH